MATLSGDRFRSLLFLPATRPERLDRALASGADRVCVDLEDGVGADAKDAARDEIVRMLNRGDALERIVVRINSPRTEAGLRDLLALRNVSARVLSVMIPKVESGEEVRWIVELLAGRYAELGILPLIETARAIEAANGIVTASPHVEAVMLGGLDLSVSLGAAPEWEPLLHARSRIVAASAAAGIPAIDGVVIDLNATDTLREEAVRARRLGFSGKAAIHPDQIPVIHQAFAPTEEEVRLARRIVAAYEASGCGVTVLDGRMIDLPVVRNAQRILSQSGPDEGAKT